MGKKEGEGAEVSRPILKCIVLDKREAIGQQLVGPVFNIPDAIFAYYGLLGPPYEKYYQLSK